MDTRFEFEVGCKLAKTDGQKEVIENLINVMCHLPKDTKSDGYMYVSDEEESAMVVVKSNGHISYMASYKKGIMVFGGGADNREMWFDKNFAKPENVAEYISNVHL